MNTGTSNAVGARVEAGDFVKGLLVVGMLLYHAAYVLLQDVDPIEIQRRVTPFVFLSGAWVFISGLIIAIYYRNRFRERPGAISRRLVIRGAKLILVFLVLNIAMQATGIAGFETWDRRELIQVLTYGDARRASFEILLGIGYVLMLSPVLLWMRGAGPWVALLAIVAASVASAAGFRIPGNLWSVLCGFGGIVAGQAVSAFGLAARLGDPGLRRRLTATAFGVALAYFLVGLMTDFSKNLLILYLSGIAGILGALFLAHAWIRRLSWLDRALQLLGRYPLVGYIGQMGLLKAQAALMAHWEFRLPFPAGVLLALVVLWLAILTLDQAVRHSQRVARIYSAVFM